MEQLNCRQWLQDAGEKACLENAIRRAILSLAADEGSLLVPVADANELEFVMCCTRTGLNTTLIGQRVPLSAGLVGKALLTGETQIDAPIFKDLIQADFLALDYGNPASIVAVPLVNGARWLGVLTLVSFDPSRRFSAEEAAQYNAFAALVGLLLYKQSVITDLAELQAVNDPTGMKTRLQTAVGNVVINSPERIEAAINVLETITQLK